MNTTGRTLGGMLAVVAVVLVVLTVAYLRDKNRRGDDEIPTVGNSQQVAVAEPLEFSLQTLRRPAAGADIDSEPETLPAPVDKVPPMTPIQASDQALPAAGWVMPGGDCNAALATSPPGSYQPLDQSSATSIVFKIAGPATADSNWTKLIGDGAMEIRDRTRGRVQIKYYGGGIQGPDERVLKRIQFGQLQGGIVAPYSLEEIFPDVGIYGLPLLFESVDEAAYVRKHIDGRLRQGLREAGFESFGFATTGFAVFMSNDPVRGLYDLTGIRMLIPIGDRISYASLEAMAVSPVPLLISEVGVGLETRTIEAGLVSPALALRQRWYPKVRFITDMPFVYTMEFLALDRKAFNQMGANDQAIFSEVMTRIHCAIDDLALNSDKQAYDILLNAGIQNVPVAPDDVARIYEIVAASNRELVERGFFSKSLYNDLHDRIKEYRDQSQRN